jgi:hypothetical protein
MPITLRPTGRFRESEPGEIEREQYLFGLFGGLGEIAVVGRIPQTLARRVGALVTLVYVSRVSMQKIKHKHSDTIS